MLLKNFQPSKNLGASIITPKYLNLKKQKNSQNSGGIGRKETSQIKQGKG